MNIFTVSSPIILGRETESGICTIKFPIAKWITAYGAGGTFHLYNRRNGDTSAYPVTITSDSEYVYWTPTTADLQYKGRGEAQLDYVFGTYGETGYKKACSEVFDTKVERSIETDEDVPEPYEAWVTLVESYADRAEAASSSASGYAATALTHATSAEASAEDAEEFKDEAAAIMGLATFYLNADTGELTITYPTPYAGATFSINSNGYLEVTTE